jgi:hypothetical protein
MSFLFLLLSCVTIPLQEQWMPTQVTNTCYCWCIHGLKDSLNPYLCRKPIVMGLWHTVTPHVWLWAGPKPMCPKCWDPKKNLLGQLLCQDRSEYYTPSRPQKCGWCVYWTPWVTVVLPCVCKPCFVGSPVQRNVAHNCTSYNNFKSCIQNSPMYILWLFASSVQLWHNTCFVHATWIVL